MTAISSTSGIMTAPSAIHTTTCVEAHVEHFRVTAGLRARCIEFALCGVIVFWLGYQLALGV